MSVLANAHTACYPHMPIYRLLLVCFRNFVFVRLPISPPRIKLAVSNFARWFIGVLDRKYPILGKSASPEAQNRTNRPAMHREVKFTTERPTANVTLENMECGMWNVEYGARRVGVVGMCGYRSPLTYLYILGVYCRT